MSKKSKGRLLPILLLTYFGLLTGVTFWALRLSTIHFGQKRLEEGFVLGYDASQDQCIKKHTSLSFEDAIDR